MLQAQDWLFSQLETEKSRFVGWGVIREHVGALKVLVWEDGGWWMKRNPVWFCPCSPWEWVHSVPRTVPV